jgi:acyl carrier protein
MKDGTEAAVRKFIVDQFLFGQGGDGLAAQDSLLAKGLIDSTGVLEVTSFLEQRFGIDIEDQDLVPDNFDSIERIVRFVERKRAA